MKPTAFVRSMILIGVLCALVNCSGGDEDAGIGPVAQSASGSFVTLSAMTGTVTFMTVAATGGVMSDIIDIAGSVTPAGGVAVGVVGTIDDDDGLASASGGGYFLFGFYDDGLLGGGISGPAGTGVFATLADAAGTALTFCGDWTENGQPMPGGLISVTVEGSHAVAGVADIGDSETFLLTNSTRSGSTVNLAAFPEENRDFAASGTLAGSTASGTWTGKDGLGVNITGTWQATIQACL